MNYPNESDDPAPPPSERRAKKARAAWTKCGAGEIFTDPGPVDWVCEELEVAPGPPTLLAGYGFSGKTIAVQALALAVATGTLAFDAMPVRQGRVLHIDYEQGKRLTFERYRRLAYGHDVLERDLAGQLDVVVMPPDSLDDRDAEEALIAECVGYTLVVIDSLRAACPRLDENDSSARRVLDMLARVSERTGAAFVVIHHARKPQKDAPGGARVAVRGSGALFDAAQSVLVFSGEKGDPPRVHHEKARITGRLRDDFVLSIADVADSDDDRFGLRVTKIGAQAVDDARADRAYQAVEVAVLDAIRVNPGMSGREIVQRTKGSDRTKWAAIDALERDGKIEQRAWKRGLRWFAVEAATCGNTQPSGGKRDEAEQEAAD